MPRSGLALPMLVFVVLAFLAGLLATRQRSLLDDGAVAATGFLAQSAANEKLPAPFRDKLTDPVKRTGFGPGDASAALLNPVLRAGGAAPAGGTHIAGTVPPAPSENFTADLPTTQPATADADPSALVETAGGDVAMMAGGGMTGSGITIGGIGGGSGSGGVGGGVGTGAGGDAGPGTDTGGTGTGGAGAGAGGDVGTGTGTGAGTGTGTGTGGTGSGGTGSGAGGGDAPPTLIVNSDPVAVIGSVPEPTTWLLVILGFGGIGAALRRRGAVSVAPAHRRQS